MRWSNPAPWAARTLPQILTMPLALLIMLALAASGCAPEGADPVDPRSDPAPPPADFDAGPAGPAGHCCDGDAGTCCSDEPHAFPDPRRPRDVPPLIIADGAPPPPISGGTLATYGPIAVAGDPDRDRIHVARLDTGAVRSLRAPGEPGRVIIAGDRAYVALRTGGAVLTVEFPRGKVEQARITQRINTCAAPRGLALADGAPLGGDGPVVLVACAGGHLAVLDPARGVEIQRIPLAPDLRDVIVADGRIYVTRFRDAELLTLDAKARLLNRRRAAGHDGDHRATVAWRAVAHPDGGIWMLHQSASDAIVRTRDPNGYGGEQDFDPCEAPIVAPAVSHFETDGSLATSHATGRAVLAVDLAVLADGGVAVAAPGSDAPGTEGSFLQVFRIEPDARRACINLRELPLPADTYTAVAPWNAGFVALRRDPPAIIDSDGQVLVDIPARPVAHVGHDLFHQNPGSGLACASCHPEGGEDGHVWNFDLGPRRTQELRGGLAGSAPFHWSRDMDDMQMLMREVMGQRMGGPHMPAKYADALLAWMDAQEVERVDPLPGPGDPARGQQLFEGAAGCVGCHNGPRYTDGQLHDIGRREAVETPTLLGVGRRARLMHDGCADTLAGRFDPACGGEAHGNVAALSANGINHLIAYLDTL